MKIQIFGDIHGRDVWKAQLEGDSDKIVFVGDYFDSFTISPAEQQKNFEDICSLKLANLDKVVLLWGNHDLHYLFTFPKIRGSGFNAGAFLRNRELLSEYKWLLEPCYSIYDYLFTHAGSYNLVSDEEIRQTFHNNPEELFDKNGIFWVRPNTLKRTTVSYNQIFGHTEVPYTTVYRSAGGYSLINVDCKQPLILHL